MNLKAIFLTFIFLVFLFSGSAQMWEVEWEKQMGTSKRDMFIDVIEDVNGGFTVLGSTASEAKTDLDFWLIRFDVDGDTVWVKSIGTEKNDHPSSLAQFPDGGYVLTGKTEIEENNFQAYVLKTDEQGNKIWQKNIGNKEYKCAEKVIAEDDGGMIISGVKSVESEIENIFLAKFNSDGDVVWEKSFGGSKMACSQSLKQLPDKGFVLVGNVSEKNIPDADLLVIRFSADGGKLWEHVLESPGKNVWPECVCCSPDSNLIVVGWYGVCMNDINSEYPVFDYDLFLAKISPAGELVWTKNIDSEGSEGGNAVVIRPDGKILMAGKKETSFLGNVGSWLLLSNEKGEILNEMLLPFGFNNDQAADIINTSDGGFVVIGPGEIDLDNVRSDGWIKKFKAF
jgi:hypothetical protein